MKSSNRKSSTIVRLEDLGGSEIVTFSNEKAIWDTIDGINGQNLDGRSVMVSEAQSHGIGDGGSGVGFSDPSQAGSGVSRRVIPICSLGGAVRARFAPSVVDLSFDPLDRVCCWLFTGPPVPS